MAVIYTKTGRTKIAREHFQKAYPILKAKNDLYYLPEYFYHLAVLHQGTGNIDSAIIMIEEGLKILIDIGNNDKIISSKLLKANLILDSDFEHAFRIAGDVKKPILNGNDKSQKSSLYKLLYECYKKQGKYELALEMNEQYLLYADSVIIEGNKTAIVREALRADYNAKLFDNRLEAEKREAQLKLRQLKLVYSLVLIGAIIILILFFYYRFRIKKNKAKRDLLLDEIEKLKRIANKELLVDYHKFELSRKKLETRLDRKLNETDWKVLNILLDDPAISNKEISEKADKSIDGIGSSLRRMYEYFEIKESKYKKITLLLEAIRISNSVV